MLVKAPKMLLKFGLDGGLPYLHPEPKESFLEQVCGVQVTAV